MKRFSFLFIAMLMFGTLAIAQNDVLEFAQKKSTATGSVIYFDVVGINGDEHANAILEDFLSDQNVQSGRYFVSSAQKDRYQLYVNNTVTAKYILDILKTHGADYDYTSISVNGYVKPEPNKDASGDLNLQRTNVPNPGFPKFVDTGNKLQDEQRYADEKNKWISEHPQEYEQMINGQVNKEENK